MMTSAADFSYLSILPTGIPRPSSETETELSVCTVMRISEQCPARASSMELSTISHTRWCSPRGPVEPMYMPGRRLTASSPSRTWIELASYVLPECLVAALAPKEDPPHLMFREKNNTVLISRGLHP